MSKANLTVLLKPPPIWSTNTFLIGDGTKFSPQTLTGDLKFDKTIIGKVKIVPLTNTHFKSKPSSSEKLDVNKTKLIGGDGITLTENTLAINYETVKQELEQEIENKHIKIWNKKKGATDNRIDISKTTLDIDTNTLSWQLDENSKKTKIKVRDDKFVEMDHQGNVSITGNLTVNGVKKTTIGEELIISSTLIKIVFIPKHEYP